MALSLLFGIFCLAIVSKFTIARLILFSLKLILLRNHTLSHLEAVHAVDKSQPLQGIQEPFHAMILLCKLGKSVSFT